MVFRLQVVEDEVTTRTEDREDLGTKSFTVSVSSS